MKKFFSLLLCLSMIALALPAFAGEAASETITISTLNGNRETMELAVPYDPQRIAVLDMASLDILDRLGVGDRVVGSATTALDYLQAYVTNEEIAINASTSASRPNREAMVAAFWRTLSTTPISVSVAR